jgi:3-deoxy-D-manno-octulosonic acid kinase
VWHRHIVSCWDVLKRMTKDGGQRIATANGAMLADPGSLGNVGGGDVAGETIFEPKFWADRGQLVDVTAGRGSAWFIAESQRWVLRHFRRGGFVARISRDRYIWAGENRVRAFAEWRLLENLSQRGLPVPKPIAARYQRVGLVYRCDLITQRIPDALPLSSRLARGPLCEAQWREIGATIERLHGVGVDHADLNAHNVLLDDRGGVSVIDFDRSRLRGPGAWPAKNLDRLHRSLAKISRDLPADRFSRGAWQALLAGYGTTTEPGS